MREYQPRKIWFATDRRARTWVKCLPYDDGGSLTIQTDMHSFQGRHHAVNIPKNEIQDIQLSRQSLNMIPQLAFVGILYFLLTSRGLSTAIVLSIIGCQFLLALFMNHHMMWVKITYQAESGVKAVWFFDGSNFGWAGFLGGTQKLWAIINADASSLTAR